MNRNQNRLDVLLADPNTGDNLILLTETDPAWIDVPEEVQFVGRTGSCCSPSETVGGTPTC